MSTMDFESPDVEKDFPGLYASESGKKSNESDFSDDTHERILKKDLIIGKRKDKKDSKKDRGYATLEGESSAEEDSTADVRSPSKAKKSKPFIFPSKKEKREKSREKESKDKDLEKEKDKKKDCDKEKEKKKDGKIKLKSSKDRRKLKHSDENCDIEDQPIFGVSLQLALERSRCHDGVEIPLVVRNCIMHIEETGLSTEGIYKISGMKSKVQHLRRAYNQREPINLIDYDLAVVTSLLKLFLRELPESLLTSKLSGKFEEASGIRDIATRGVELSSLIKQLPASNMQLLSWIVNHLVSVTMHEKQNKMSAQSMSQILSQPLQISQRLLVALMYHADLLFSGTKLTKYIPPLTSSSSDLPETADEITKELQKQESLLGQIHSEMNAGYVTKEREELLWEVQRMITQLKRKFKSLEKEAVESHHPSQQNQNPSAGNCSGAESTISENPSDIRTSSTIDHYQQPQNNNNNISTAVNISSTTMSASSVVTNSTNSFHSSITRPDLVKNDSNINSCTKHVVEAVIENVSLDDDDDDPCIDHDDNNINVDNKNDVLPMESLSGAVKDVHSIDSAAFQASALDKMSIDELALKIETEELLALVAQLQSQIEQEKSNVACLRSEVRNLGGSPSFCDYLLESCCIDIGTGSGAVTGGDKDSLCSGAANDEVKSSVPSLLKEVKRESHLLQMRNKNLTSSIIEEQESIIRLRVQMKLLSLNNTSCVIDNVLGAITAVNTVMTSSVPAGGSGDHLQNISSPTVTAGADDKLI